MAVRVRVEDHNVNDPGRFDTVGVTMSSLATGDAEGLTLLEVAKDSGIFAGSLATQTNASVVLSDGRLQVQVGEEVEAMHMDANGVLASGDRARIESAAISFVDEAGRPTVELLENGTARVRVISLGSNGNPGVAETLTVQLQSLYAGDQEQVVLTETGPDTSIFEGIDPALLLSLGPAGQRLAGDEQPSAVPRRPGDGELRPVQRHGAHHRRAGGVHRRLRAGDLDGPRGLRGAGASDGPVAPTARGSRDFIFDLL